MAGNLAEMKVGESACITALRTTGEMRRRLQDLGLVEGTWVQCALKSPSGDPAAYQVRGATIALRREDARNILVC